MGRCIFARREDALEKVKRECEALGISGDRMICVVGDVTNTDDLLAVRGKVINGEPITILEACCLVSLLKDSLGRLRHTPYPCRRPFHVHPFGSGRGGPRTYVSSTRWSDTRT